jgi:hypothetical protein
MNLRLLPNTIVPSDTYICEAAQSIYTGGRPWSDQNQQWSARHLDIAGRFIYKEPMGFSPGYFDIRI